MKLVFQIAAGVMLGLLGTSLVAMLFATVLMTAAVQSFDQALRSATQPSMPGLRQRPTTRKSPAADEPSLNELQALSEALELRDEQRARSAAAACNNPWQITTREGKRYSGCGRVPPGGLQGLTPDNP